MVVLFDKPLETSASIGVQKKRPSKKPEFLSTIAPITITEGDTLNTKVIISGDPEPYAKWYINNIVRMLTFLTNGRLDGIPNRRYRNQERKRRLHPNNPWLYDRHGY